MAKKNLTKAEKHAIKKALLLVPCETKEQLHRWIKMYLGVDLPDCTVDPESTSNPMDFVWEVYSNGLKQNPDFSRVMAYAAREAMKTVSEAILELLFVLHFEREVGHMAAIKFQAHNAQRYVKDYCRKPFIKDFVTSDNDTRIEFTRYKHEDGRILSPAEWRDLSADEQDEFECVINKIVIVVATLNSTNSLHAQLFCEDELDLCPPAPLEEAKMVPTQGKKGEPSITVITSSRKFAMGPVQKELDNASKSGLHVRHWNIIDVTEPCPASRHKPEKPKLPIYVDDTTLAAISEEDFENLSTQAKENYKKYEGYWGCLNNCKMFGPCKGRLATEQTSKSTMLKKLTEVQTKFKTVDVDFAKAQLLCWKPSKEGMIYPRLDPDTHCISARAMAKKITGHDYPKDFGKAELIELMKTEGLQFYAGLDHGHSHLFAVVTGAVSGNCLYIFDVIAKAELELAQKVDELQEVFGNYGIDPDVFPDPEDPGANKTLSRKFRVRTWKKGPGSVVDGINIVRMKLNPTMKKEPELFFLKDDPGVDFLIKQAMQYHWKVDAAERLTGEPDKSEDDAVDALRYLVMNVFGKKGQLVVGQGLHAQNNTPITPQQQWGQQMKDRIRELTDGNTEDAAPIVKGRFYYKG